MFLKNIFKNIFSHYVWAFFQLILNLFILLLKALKIIRSRIVVRGGGAVLQNISPLINIYPFRSLFSILSFPGAEALVWFYIPLTQHFYFILHRILNIQIFTLERIFVLTEMSPPPIFSLTQILKKLMLDYQI